MLDAVKVHGNRKGWAEKMQEREPQQNASSEMAHQTDRGHKFKAALVVE